MGRTLTASFDSEITTNIALKVDSDTENQAIELFKHIGAADKLTQIVFKYLNDTKYPFINEPRELIILLLQIYLCLGAPPPERGIGKLNGIINAANKLKSHIADSHTQLLLKEAITNKDADLDDIAQVFSVSDNRVKQYLDTLEEVTEFAEEAKKYCFSREKTIDDIRACVKHTARYWQELWGQKYTRNFNPKELVDKKGCKGVTIELKNTPISPASTFTYEIIYFAKQIFEGSWNNQIYNFDIFDVEHCNDLATPVSTAMEELIKEQKKSS